MRKLFAALAVLGIATAPAVAQTTPEPAPAEKPKTVTKVVCERVNVEETTGSRLGSAPRKCRKVEVPAPSATAKDAHKGHSQDHSGHTQ